MNCPFKITHKYRNEMKHHNILCKVLLRQIHIYKYFSNSYINIFLMCELSPLRMIEGRMERVNKIDH